MEPSIAVLQRSLDSPAGTFTHCITRFGRNDEITGVHHGSPQDLVDTTFPRERPLQEAIQVSAHRTGVVATSTPDQAGMAHHVTLAAATSLASAAPWQQE